MRKSRTIVNDGKKMEGKNNDERKEGKEPRRDHVWRRLRETFILLLTAKETIQQAVKTVWKPWMIYNTERERERQPGIEQ